MFKKVKKLKLRGRIYAVVATERFERMDILTEQNTESINLNKLSSSAKPFFLNCAS